MRSPKMTAAMLPLCLLAACSDSTGFDGFATEELTAELTITPDHFHIWETEGTFAVSVVDPDDRPVTDFDLLQVERRVVGSLGSWAAFPLAVDGDLWVGTYTFETSGDYNLRVAGLRPSDDTMKVVFQAEAPLAVVRAHADMGGRRLELETFPGHIHAADRSTVTFWVMDPTRNAAGVRPPITGLTPRIWVESGGVRANYTARESQPGVYVADHVFALVGRSTVGIRFPGVDGVEQEWSLPITVHAPH